MADSANGPLRILVLEDNPGDALLLRVALGEMSTEPFELTHVERVADAVDRLARGPFDLILSDLSVPDSSGLDTFRRLHAQAPSLPIIMLTGNTDEQLALDIVRSGAQDYLIKGQANGHMLWRVIHYALERKRAQEAIRETAQMKADFASMVSHELRTPLSVIVEGVDLVLDGTAGPLNDQQREYLHIAKRNMDRLSRLINSVLDYQKLEAGRMEFHLQRQPLNDVVRETLEGFAPVAQKKGLTLQSQLADGLPAVTCDRDKIAQVVSNLLSNAIKFTEAGAITVSTQQAHGVLYVSVHNPGPGISEADQARLFHSFSQLSAGVNRKAGGTGLGLAICKRIIEQHRGHIAVQATPGQGATFYFTLPIEEPATNG